MDNPTWQKRIEDATANEGFTDEDKSDSADWDTCAVGECNMRKGKPTFNIETRKQMSVELEAAGMDFWRAVAHDRIPKVKRLLGEVQTLFGLGPTTKGTLEEEIANEERSPKCLTKHK